MLKCLLWYSLCFHFVWLQLAIADHDETNTTTSPTSIMQDIVIAKPGCQPKCGNLTVPYPFGVGIGSGCSLGKGFEINCSTSFNPPKPFWGTGEVIDISNSQMRVKTYVASTCYDQFGNLTSRGPFVLTVLPPFSFSNSNKFTTVGCEDVATIQGSGGTNFSSGCVSLCYAKEDIFDGPCQGNGCCQISIPKGVRRLTASVIGIYNHSNVSTFSRCGYSFLAEQDRFLLRSSDISDTTFINRTMENIPLVLDWVIGNQTCSEAEKSSDFACRKNSNCIDSDPKLGGYHCSCFNGYEGNPYLDPGCRGSTLSLLLQCQHFELHIF